MPSGGRGSSLLLRIELVGADAELGLGGESLGWGCLDRTRSDRTVQSPLYRALREGARGHTEKGRADI